MTNKSESAATAYPLHGPAARSPCDLDHAPRTGSTWSALSADQAVHGIGEPAGPGRVGAAAGEPDPERLGVSQDVLLPGRRRPVQPAEVDERQADQARVAALDREIARRVDERERLVKPDGGVRGGSA